MKDKTLKFSSVSSARTISGSLLCFPRRRRLPQKFLRRVGEVAGVTIGASAQGALGGTWTRSQLFVDLPLKEFEQLRAELRRRDLKALPITFSFDLDKEDELVELRVDGKAFPCK